MTENQKQTEVSFACGCWPQYLSLCNTLYDLLIGLIRGLFRGIEKRLMHSSHVSQQITFHVEPLHTDPTQVGPLPSVRPRMNQHGRCGRERLVADWAQLLTARHAGFLLPRRRGAKSLLSLVFVSCLLLDIRVIAQCQLLLGVSCLNVPHPISRVLVDFLAQFTAEGRILFIILTRTILRNDVNKIKLV